MLKTYQFKTNCKGDSHSSKTANIILPGLMIEYKWMPLRVQNRHWLQRCTAIRWLMRGMATLTQGNQELLVVRYKVWTPPGELGVTTSTECDTVPFSALTLLVGWQEGNPACKKLGVGLLVVMIWLELCTTCSSSCHQSPLALIEANI